MPIADMFPGDSSAQAYYDALCVECQKVQAPSLISDMMIADAVRLERLKTMLDSDIQLRGAGYDKHNGRQTYYQDNKSVPLLLKTMEQQRKLFERLGLVQRDPDRPKVNDDGSDFDDF